MEKIMEVYRQLFPQVGFADWFFAFVGLLLHALTKLKNIPKGKFRWKTFIEDFGGTWVISFITIVVCLGTLPYYLPAYTPFDSACVGYVSSSLYKQLLKQRLSTMGEK